MKTVAIPDANLNARVIKRCHLLEIQAGQGSATFYRFTDHNIADVVVTIDGVPRTFVRQYFALSNIVTSSDEQQNCEVTFIDANQIIKGIALTYNLLDWPVKIWECWFDSAIATPTIVGSPELAIDGIADGMTCQEEGLLSRVTLGILASRLPEQSNGPKQEYSVGCRFRYKDEQCAATSLLPDCGRTLPECIVRNNQERYGGFPYAPKPGAKFMWGPTQQIVNARPVWVTN